MQGYTSSSFSITSFWSPYQYSYPVIFPKVFSAHLFERVIVEDLEAVDVEDTDDSVPVLLLGDFNDLVDPGNNPIEEPFVHSLPEGVTPVHGVLGCVP